MAFKHGRKPHLRLGLATVAALVIAAAVLVPLAFANTATPTTSHSSWHYVNGSSGPVEVVVRGDWNWVTQSCAAKGGKSGGTVSQTDVNGHYAIGFAGSWNDSTTPNTLTGKATNGQQVTLHVGNTMDQVIVDYCQGTTAANPYPTGSYEISHTYPSLDAYRAAHPQDEVCVNGYDIHQTRAKKPDDWNPGKNGDNTLKAGQYVLGKMCTKASPPRANPALTLVKLERVGDKGTYRRGPVTGKVGQVVEYKMIVRNTGDTSLDVTLSDPRCDAGTLSRTGSVSMSPGDSAVFFCTHRLTGSDVPKYVNTATASGQSASASSSVTATSSVVAKVKRRPRPALTLRKLERVGTDGTYVRGPVSAGVGQTIYYEMIVRNTGNTSLDVTLSDPRCDAGTLSQTTAVTMAPGDTTVYFCSHELTSSDVPKFVNVATANGQGASASSSVNATSKVVAKVAGVAGAKHLKRVEHKAKPAKPVVRAASFTG